MSRLTKAFQPITENEEEARDARYAFLSHLISIFSVSEFCVNNETNTVVVTATDDIMLSIEGIAERLFYNYDIRSVDADEDIALQLTDKLRESSNSIKELTKQLKDSTSSAEMYKNLYNQGRQNNNRMRQQIMNIAQLLNVTFS